MVLSKLKFRTPAQPTLPGVGDVARWRRSRRFPLFQRRVISLVFADGSFTAVQNQRGSMLALLDRDLHLLTAALKLFPVFLNDFRRKDVVVQVAVLILRDQRQYIHRTVLQSKLPDSAGLRGRVHSDFSAASRDERSLPVFLQRM